MHTCGSIEGLSSDLKVVNSSADFQSRSASRISSSQIYEQTFEPGPPNTGRRMIPGNDSWARLAGPARASVHLHTSIPSAWLKRA
jgi:hypothetical protein